VIGRMTLNTLIIERGGMLLETEHSITTGRRNKSKIRDRMEQMETSTRTWWDHYARKQIQISLTNEGRNKYKRHN
jgi:hypothetical protein